MAKKRKTASLSKDLHAERPVLAGAATTLIFFTVGAGWTSDNSNLVVTAGIFVWLFAVMIWCAFGVVRHAEVLAEHLGEPFGTLILTVSAVSIEVTIMATVMLSGDPNPTLPRDTVFAVLMIVLNGMIGLSVIAGAMHHRQQQYNLQGAVAFLAVISSLAVISLVLPTFTTSTADHSMTTLQAIVFGLLTALLYGGFLAIQTMRHRAFFEEARAANRVVGAEPAHEPVHGPKRSVAYHAVLLIVTLLPVVLLSEQLAKVIDFGIETLHAPTTLGGILIAILILSPEGLTSYQAARRNQLQRSVNLSLGSALSTIGLTIPVMLALSLAIGIPLELGLAPVQAILLALTLFITQMTFSGAPTNILLGGVHLVLFATFVVLIFNP
ncbi:MAG TPA: calcium:proton antiporter [Pseudolabrys sp.]